MIRVGLVGLGKIGKRHLDAYRRVHGAEVVAICDADPYILAQASVSHKITKYSDYTKLLHDESIDIVDMCTPTHLHHLMILQALAMDKHVFCEKPLTHRLVYAQEIERQVKATGRLVTVGYLYRFHPSFTLLKQLLTDRIIGDPYFAILRIGGRGGWRVWKHKRMFAGGALLEMMTHMLDLACYWFGDFVAYHTYRDTILPERRIEGKTVRVDAEDCLLFRLETEQGVTVFCEADLVTPSYMNYVEVHGTNGSYLGSILPEIPTMIYCQRSRRGYKQGKTVIHYPMIDLLQKELQHFVASVHGSRKPLNCVGDSVKVLKAIEDVVVSGNIHDLMRTHGTELLPPLDEELWLECPNGHQWRNRAGDMWRCPVCGAFSGVKPITK